MSLYTLLEEIHCVTSRLSVLFWKLVTIPHFKNGYLMTILHFMLIMIISGAIPPYSILYIIIVCTLSNE